MSGTGWLADAVFYEIYPQSFADSDGDGIGDLPGALAHLDHLAWLGVDAVWFNPCFASPFRDAGYDVSDYLQDRAAVRHQRGHGRLRRGGPASAASGSCSTSSPGTPRPSTSGSGARPPTRPTTATSGRTGPGPGFVPSPGPRPGYYLKNFYDEQPALNFGYARSNPAEPWREPVDAPGPAGEPGRR